MIRILFLILVVLSSVAFAQTEKKEPIKFFEFGTISDKLLKVKFDSFFIKLEEGSNFDGYIVNYGTNDEITKREKQIQKILISTEQQSIRVSIARGGESEKQKTVLWIVPDGGKPPIPERK